MVHSKPLRVVRVKTLAERVGWPQGKVDDAKLEIRQWRAFRTGRGVTESEFARMSGRAFRALCREAREALKDEAVQRRFEEWLKATWAAAHQVSTYA